MCSQVSQLSRRSPWVGRYQPRPRGPAIVAPAIDAAAYLAESMRSPGAFVSPVWQRGAGPAVGMPVLRLDDDDEIDALVDYLLESVST